jgi:hypothetical protein
VCLSGIVETVLCHHQRSSTLPFLLRDQARSPKNHQLPRHTGSGSSLLEHFKSNLYPTLTSIVVENTSTKRQLREKESKIDDPVEDMLIGEVGHSEE